MAGLEETPGSSPTQQFIPLTLLEKESKLMSSLSPSCFNGISRVSMGNKYGGLFLSGSLSHCVHCSSQIGPSTPASVISLTHLSSASVSAILTQASGAAAVALGQYPHHHASLQASHKARSFSANALYASTGWLFTSIIFLFLIHSIAS